jgi:hypothetical protein
VTLQEIQNLAMAEYGNRYQITPGQYLRYFNIVQALAFDKDLEAFKDFSNTLTILQQFNVDAFTVAPVAGDVGKKVVGTSSGNEGTLRYYENSSARTIVAVDLDDEDAPFEDGEAFTITAGTGTGTFEASEAQETYKGPYDFPTSPLCRKLVGLTKATDAQLFAVSPTTTGDDYGFTDEYNPERIWEKVRVSLFGTGRTLTFVDTPSTSAVYRWVYYIRPPVIAGVTAADDANLRIPLEYHWQTFYQAVIALCDNATYGEKQPLEVILPYLEPFWDALRTQSRPLGGIYDVGISTGGLP